MIKKLASFCLILAAGVIASRADTLYWDPAANGSQSGGSGTWDLNVTANWYGSAGEVKWTESSAFSTNSAVFSGTAGTVTLNASLSASNLTFYADGYTLSGAGTLTLGGGGIDANSTYSGTTTIGCALNLAGPQQQWQSTSGGTLAVNGVVTRGTGAAVDFTVPGITSTSLANDGTGILGAWATVGAYNSFGAATGDWAAKDGSGNITNYAGYTIVSDTNSSSPNLTGAASQNWLSGDPTGAANYTSTITNTTSLHSLVMQGDVVVNSGATLTLDSGGLILRGVSRWMSAGSSTTSHLTSGASTGELFMHAPNDTATDWRIWPLIQDNGSTPVQVIKDGVGPLIIENNNNSYSGGTILNGGMFFVRCDFAAPATVHIFGSGPITVNNGMVRLGMVGVVNAAFGEYDYTNAFVLNGGVVNGDDGFHFLKGNLSVASGGGTLGATFDNKGDALLGGYAKGLFVDGFLTGSGPLTIQDSGLETVNAWDSSVVYFRNMGTAAQNSYSGTVNVMEWSTLGGSYLYLIGTNALANATINVNGDNSASSGRFGSPALLFGSGTNLDGIGYATIGGLTGYGNFPLANTLVTQSGSSLGAAFALSVGGNNSSTTYNGIMSGAGSLTKVGTGTLTLSGVNTYTGGTTVNGGTLALSGGFGNSTNFTVAAGGTLDISSLGTMTLSTNLHLTSGGTINGTIDVSSGSVISAGTDGGYGTNVITGSLTLETGALALLDVGTSATGANDRITAGSLVVNNNSIHLKAPSTAANLDSVDYVLFSSSGGISGSFATAPAWDVAPANAAHYSIVTGANTVTLHYSAIAGPTGVGSATPSPAVRNQKVLITVTAANGTGGTVNSVTVDTSSIGGSTTFALVNSGNNVWTNTITVGPDALAGSKTLVATLTDTVPLIGLVNIPLTVVAQNEVWNGAGADNNFSTALNWTNLLAPGYVGDSLEFDGTTRLSPNMANSYTVTGLTFDSGAGSFNIGTANSSTLTLAGGLINNSANAQTVSAPVALSGSATVNAAAGDVAFSGGISGSGNLAKVGNGALTLSGSSGSSSGNLKVLGGTMNVTGGSTAFGSALSYVGYLTNSGNLNISGGSFTTAGELQVGGSDINGTNYNAVGTLTVSGGANVSLGKLTVARGNNNQNTVSGIVTVNSGSTLSSENDMLLGFAGNNNLGKVVVNGGTVNEATTTTRWLIMGQWDTARSEFDVNSGQLNVNANTSIKFAINGNTSTNTFNLNGGAVTFYSDNATTIGGSGVLDLHQGNGATCVNTFNLNGGILTVPGVTTVNASGSRTFNFNGGTLKAAAGSATFMNLGAGNAVANVRNGGAIIDDGGSSISIDQALVHSTIVGDDAADGGLTKSGVGTLTLNGTNTYNGATLINAGTLALGGLGSISSSTNIQTSAGAIFDVSAVVYTNSKALSGSGNVNGSVDAAASAKIYGGTDGTYGTNTFNNDLVLESGAACYLDLGTSATGNNDQIVVSGTLTGNGNYIHVKAPSSASNLDTADYVLITSANAIAGSFASSPVWDVAPANAGHYTVVTSGNTVTLHYDAAASGPVITSASGAPSTLLRNEPVFLSATVLAGNAAISTVTVDLSPIGGSTVSLVQSNGTTTYTNTIAVPAVASAGSPNLTVTATDTSALSGSAGISLTINTSTEVWNGGGGNQNWSTNPNWFSGYAPGYVGDGLVFAGSSGLTPNMDANYSVTGLTFSNNASSFNIGTANSSTLTITANGVANNSANAQTVNVPVVFSAAPNINAAAGDITLGQTVDSGGSALAVNGAFNSTIAGAVSNGSNLNKTGSGTLTLSGTDNSLTGVLNVLGGTLNITGGATTLGTDPSYVGYRDQSGNMNISGGSFTTTGELRVGYSDLNGTNYNAVGNLTVSGGANVSVGKVVVGRGNNNQNTVSGTVTVNSGSTLSSENDILLGFAGNTNLGKLVVNGGTVNVATTTTRWVILSQWDTSQAEIDMNSGQMNINANTSIKFAINGNTGTNVFNLNGGAITFYSDNATTIGGTGVLDLHQGNGGSVVNTFNLNGGILTVPAVTTVNASGSRTFNFNGGTLKPTADNATFMNLGSGTAVANVRDGGAIVDDGGFSVTIAQPLLHSAIAGDNAKDGGLTKLGAGTLTLSGANTYNGNTTVSAGTLDIVSPVLAAASTVSVANGAMLKLDFATTNAVTALVLNGTTYTNGVHNSTTDPSYITGSGSLLLTPAGPSGPGYITNSISGNTLTLSWPAGQGWLLQMQTNSLSKGLGTNWVTVPGSSAMSSTNITVDPSMPTTFYRLKY